MDINLPLEPPVNNKIQPTIYDKVNQMVFEKIKVANKQLNSRLEIHDKIIEKHRKDIERTHLQQTERLKREAVKIREKKPDYVYEESESGFSRTRAEAGLARSLSDSNSNASYCRRYYSHHYHLKDDTKKDKGNAQKKDSNLDFFNFKLRLYYLHTHNALEQTKARSDEFDFSKTVGGNNATAPDISPREDYYTQSSVDEGEGGDVFDSSHDSFKTGISKLKHQSLNCLAGSSEHNAENPEHTSENPEEAFLSSDVHMQPRRHLLRRESERARRRRRKRAISDSQSENLEVNRRKSRLAFEKIFNGLL
ncbi:hypothetical protein DPMN_168342 [Dreissena polymorpha]|uniref:Uncharacterized protein n=1 Tax=Dreissena polymorpha TaxID=45954 RepID=A0A9D4IZH8_DREPO|nr:hypothetical protein DPMN_168342 [Dreissena polymorpha]